MSFITQFYRKATPINTWQRRGDYIYLNTDKGCEFTYNTNKYFRAESLHIQFRKFKPLPIDEKGKTKVRISYKRHDGLSKEKTTHEEMCETFQDKDSAFTLIYLKPSPLFFHLIKDVANERGNKTIEIEHYGTFDIPDTGFAIGHTELEIKRLKKHLTHVKKTERDFSLYLQEQLKMKNT
jgi:hypothetical protein